MIRILKKEITYNWVKENISMLILAPTIVGGLWQLFELSVIDIAYIRFFSISQLVSDGILILLISALIIACTSWLSPGWWFSIKYIFKENHIINNAYNKSPKLQNPSWLYRDKKGNRALGTLIALAILITFGATPLIAAGHNTKESAPLIIILLQFLLAGCVLRFMTMLAKKLLDMRKATSNGNNEDVKKIVEFLRLILLMTGIMSALYLMDLFRRSFSLPANFKNLENIHHKIEATNSNLKMYEIVYFNDKYVFVHINTDSCREYMQVLKFEEFTDDNISVNKKKGG